MAAISKKTRCGSFGWLAVVAVAGVLACAVSDARAQGQATTVPSSRPASPHIVLIIIDTLRPDHLGCYGYARATSPEIDRLAAGGTLFKNCYSPASWTTPSIMSIFTGLLPSAHGCQDYQTVLSKAIPTLGQQLSARGYQCVGIVSNPAIAGKYGFSRGFTTYDDSTVIADMDLKVSGAASVSTARLVTGEAGRLLREAVKSPKPVFLFVHYMDPHDDYFPPPPFNRMFDADYAGEADGRGINKWRDKLPAGPDLKHLVSLYDGEIASTDQQVGKLLKDVRELLPPERTLVILIGDHGEAFGEHGKLLHGNSAYREETQVPMIWNWKGTVAAGRVDAPVSTLDIARTLKDVVGLGDMDLLQGASLWPGLTGGKLAADRAVVSEKAQGNVRHLAVIRGDMRLHRVWTEGSNVPAHELYDLANDPWESKNLDGHADAGDLMRVLDEVTAASKAIYDSVHAGNPSGRAAMGAQDIRRLKELGYINR